MRQVNIHDAKTHLSRLVAEAAQGRPFVIARAGRPMVEVRALAPAGDAAGRIGFLGGAVASAPVKAVGAEAVAALLGDDAP